MSSPDLELYKRALHAFYNRVQDVTTATIETDLENTTRFLYALYRKHWIGTDLGSPLHLEMLEDLLEMYEWPLNKTDEEGSTTPLYTLRKANEFLQSLVEAILQTDVGFGKTLSHTLSDHRYSA